MDTIMGDPDWSLDSNPMAVEPLFEFANPIGNKINARKSIESKRGRSFACTRCHAQKLRCVRPKSDTHICNRCSSAGRECVERRPQKMGRPVVVDTQLSWSHHQSDTGPSRSSSSTPALWSPTHLGRPERSAATSPSNISPPDTRLVFDGRTTQPTAHAIPDVNLWTEALISEEHCFPYRIESSAQTVDSFSITSNQEAEKVNLNSKLNNFNLMFVSDDEHVARLLNPLGEEGPSSLESHEKLNREPDPELTLEDPVEHLSNVHLRLYKCLKTAKLVETQIKRRLCERPNVPTEPIDASWSRHLFETTEAFIKALEAYAGSLNSSAGSSFGIISDTDIMRDQLDTEKPFQVLDIATGLMIVSSYMRLLQIFEVLVFALEKPLDVDLTSGYVQVRFGEFVPTANKTFFSRILGQYLLHLLDAMFAVVSRVVVSHQPYVKAIADSRTVRAVLKERILTVLQ